MSTELPTLAELGWSNFFQSQLTIAELAGCRPARVLAVHRNGLDIASSDGPGRVRPVVADDPEERPAVGDWLILNAASGRPTRVLERKSVFKRKAAGVTQRIQLIAANVDTLLIVTSCNQDFNVARLERYLALAREAGVMPVVVITRADLTDDADGYRTRALAIMPGLLAETVDAREPASAAILAAWCGKGQTVALVGSSGVGKSTLVNTLAADAAQVTAAIREDDAHGRHTTSSRSMHRLAAGGWLIDTPGMRELQLADAADGVADVFADIAELAGACRFADCRHEAEPGCAVRAALDAGSLDPARLARYRKLTAEEARNSEAIHERRARERGFGKMVKAIVKGKADRGEA
jgi:ribosome biogenesis GTPase